MSSPADVLDDVPCRLPGAAAEAFREVLEQVRDGWPDDWARIRQVVREVLPLAPGEGADGTLGEWRADRPRSGVPSTWGYGVGETPGVLLVDPALEADALRAVIAHELGHACTVMEDLDGRGTDVFEEWRSEATADWYAYRWGFGPVIDRTRAGRDWTHHGPEPGTEMVVEVEDGDPVRVRLTPSFVFEVVG